MPAFDNPEYTLDDINNRLTAVTIQKDEMAARLLAYIKPLMKDGIIKTSAEVRELLPKGFSSQPNEWQKLGIADSERGGGDLFVRTDAEGNKIYQRVKHIVNIMSGCSQQFNDLVKKGLFLRNKQGTLSNKKIGEQFENPEYTLDDINNRLTARTIQKDETSARLEAYIKAATAKGLVKKESEIEFHSEWRKLHGVMDRDRSILFVRNTDEGDKVYNHVMHLIDTIAKCVSDFNELVTKRGLLIKKAMFNRINEELENPNLDNILHELIELIIKGQNKNDDKFGRVAACLMDDKGNQVKALNYALPDGHRVHAERAAIEKYQKEYGDVPPDSIIITTLSPCSEHMHDRAGQSCTDLLNYEKIRKVYCGYIDPTQREAQKKFDVVETGNEDIRAKCKKIADTFL